MKQGLRAVVAFIWAGACFPLVHAQQEVHVEVYPGTSRAVEGHLNLDRKKYINVAASGTNIEGTIGDQELTDFYFKELKMTLGRALGMVYGEVGWGNSIFEDAARPGYTDIPRLKSKLNPSNGGASPEFINLIGPNQHVAFHDRHDSYPDFMEKYHVEGTKDYLPVNTDAASELAATLLEFNYTDWTKPAYYEPINEPAWQNWGDSRFISLHSDIHSKVHQAGLPVEVGGPCFSVGYHYKNKYGSLGSLTSFIDRTNFSLDFYSYHIYDYMHWNDAADDFTGSVSSGLPTEGVFDAIANYTVNKYGRPFSYVASEHGGYINADNKEQVLDMIAQKYFPGSGFAYTMEKRSIADFLAVSSELGSTFTFMNNPHIVKKAVPFILIETTGWDPAYYATLLVAENFQKGAPWWPSKRIQFYQFFRDVAGRRVLSFCDDTDIQHHAFVNGNTLILIFHNQSNVEGTINLDLPGFSGTVKDMTARKLGRKPDFRPYFTEERLFGHSSVNIRAREAVALFIEYDKPIPQERILDEEVHYGDKTGQKFTGSMDFTIHTPRYEDATYAILRVGIGLEGTASKNVNLSLNGTPLVSPVEDCAERLAEGDYGSTRIVRVDTSLLLAVNTIQVIFPDGQEGGVGAAVIRAGYDSADTLSGFSFSRHRLSLYINQSDSVEVTFLPETTAERQLTWHALDESVATVSGDGIITGRSEGSTGIVALSADGTLSDTCIVTVETQDLFSLADKSAWKAIYADDEGFVHSRLKEHAIDDDPDTYWHTEWTVFPLSGLPHEIWVDMADTLTFDHFFYTPRQDQWGPNGTIGKYELYFSNDTSQWGFPADTGTFVWDTGTEYYYKEIKEIVLESPVTARFMRFVAVTEHQNNPDKPHTAVAELDVGTEASGVRLRDESLEVTPGESVRLEALSLPLLSVMDGDQFRWYAKDPAIASVVQGVVTGESPGETDIIVETFDGLSGDTCHVQVSIVPVSEIRISMQELELNQGETVILTAEILPVNAYHDSYQWISDNEAVAPVELGYVTGADTGTARIIAVSSDGIRRDTCTVNVVTALYDVEIIVLDNITGEALQGAEVFLAGNQLNTDQEGKAIYIDVERGSQQLSVQSDRYRTAPGSVLEVGSDMQHTIRLNRNLHQVAVRITELKSGKPVDNAEVILAPSTGRTDGSGIANLIHIWGTFEYSVTKEYFVTGEGTVTIQGDTTLHIPLERELADLKFRVVDSSGSVPGATILLDDLEQTTNALGIYTFTELAVEKSYGYTVSKEGYTEASGNLWLQTDSTIEVLLGPATGLTSNTISPLVIYPVPASEYIRISVSETGIMKLYTTDGILHNEQKLEPGEHELPVSHLPPGIYLIRYTTSGKANTRLVPVSR